MAIPFFDLSSLLDASRLAGSGRKQTGTGAAASTAPFRLASHASSAADSVAHVAAPTATRMAGDPARLTGSLLRSLSPSQATEAMSRSDAPRQADSQAPSASRSWLDADAGDAARDPVQRGAIERASAQTSRIAQRTPEVEQDDFAEPRLRSSHLHESIASAGKERAGQGATNNRPRARLVEPAEDYGSGASLSSANSAAAAHVGPPAHAGDAKARSRSDGPGPSATGAGAVTEKREQAATRAHERPPAPADERAGSRARDRAEPAQGDAAGFEPAASDAASLAAADGSQRPSQNESRRDGGGDVGAAELSVEPGAEPGASAADRPQPAESGDDTRPGPGHGAGAGKDAGADAGISGAGSATASADDPVAALITTTVAATALPAAPVPAPVLAAAAEAKRAAAAALLDGMPTAAMSPAAPATADAPVAAGGVSQPSATQPEAAAASADGNTATAAATQPPDSDWAPFAPRSVGGAVALEVPAATAAANGLASLLPQLSSPTTTQPPAAAAPILPGLPLPVLQDPATMAAGLDDRLTWMLNEGIQEALIELTPDALGRIEVRVRLDGGQADVRFSSQHAEARAALERSLPQLRQMLAADGVQQAQLNVQSQALGSSPQGDGASDRTGYRQTPRQGLRGSSDADEGKSDGLAGAPRAIVRSLSLVDTWA